MEESQTNLIVNYLPQTLTDEEFKSMFLSIGTLNSCKIIRDKATNYSYGFGFVDYQKREDAERAIETLNGLQLQNKRIKVAFSRNHDKVKGANLYIKNVPRDYTQDMLRDLCKEYGNIVNVRILTDQVTGKSKGIGFILFDTRDEAQVAQKGLDGLVPDGATEPLSVRFADDNNGKARQPPVMVINQFGGPGWGGGFNARGGFGGGGPTRTQSRFNQRFNPFGNQNAGGMGASAGATGGSDGDCGGYSLFVYNIGPDTDERSLWQLFAAFGSIVKVNVVRDFDKGTSKGYGFVTMADYMEAQGAIQSLNGYRLYGKPLQVSFKRN